MSVNSQDDSSFEDVEVAPPSTIGSRVLERRHGKLKAEGGGEGMKSTPSGALSANPAGIPGTVSAAPEARASKTKKYRNRKPKQISMPDTDEESLADRVGQLEQLMRRMALALLFKLKNMDYLTEPYYKLFDTLERHFGSSRQ